MEILHVKYCMTSLLLVGMLLQSRVHPGQGLSPLPLNNHGVDIDRREPQASRELAGGAEA